MTEPELQRVQAWRKAVNIALEEARCSVVTAQEQHRALCTEYERIIATQGEELNDCRQTISSHGLGSRPKQ